MSVSRHLPFFMRFFRLPAPAVLHLCAPAAHNRQAGQFGPIESQRTLELNHAKSSCSCAGRSAHGLVERR